jgi:hypothetical protein
MLTHQPDEGAFRPVLAEDVDWSRSRLSRRPPAWPSLWVIQNLVST